MLLAKMQCSGAAPSNAVNNYQSKGCAKSAALLLPYIPYAFHHSSTRSIQGGIAPTVCFKSRVSGIASMMRSDPSAACTKIAVSVRSYEEAQGTRPCEIS